MDATEKPPGGFWLKREPRGGLLLRCRTNHSRLHGLPGCLMFENPEYIDDEAPKLVHKCYRSLIVEDTPTSETAGYFKDDSHS